MPTGLLEELRDLDTSRRSLRSFGFVVGGLICVIVAWVTWRGGSFDKLAGWPPGVLQVLGAVGIVLIGAAAVRPQVLRPLYYGWMTLAIILGMVMTRVVLSIVFILLVTPIGLIMRALGKDPLTRRIDGTDTSYWVSRSDMDRSRGRLEKYY